jgi:hypothetical protein
MRKLPTRVQAVSALFACALAGCASTVGGQAAGRPANAGALTARQVPGSGAARLAGYVPGWLRPGCTDTGGLGRHPLPIHGYSDSAQCLLRANTHTEADYYQYATAAQTRTAYSAASASGLAGTPLRPGGCAAGHDGYGQWSAGGAAIGNITCASRPGGGAVLIWDDPRTGIVAIASSPVLIPAALYAFWTAAGASIEQSAHQATSE